MRSESAVVQTPKSDRTAATQARPDPAAGPRPARPDGSGRGLRDVDHPRDAELVDAHSELVAPHLLLERNGDRAATGELVPITAELGGIIAAEADRHVVARGVLLARRKVGVHQGEA